MYIQNELIALTLGFNHRFVFKIFRNIKLYYIINCTQIIKLCINDLLIYFNYIDERSKAEKLIRLRIITQASILSPRQITIINLNKIYYIVSSDYRKLRKKNCIKKKINLLC